jgi:hypothetical protein
MASAAFIMNSHFTFRVIFHLVNESKGFSMCRTGGHQTPPFIFRKEREV